jgi:hypothetical protein
MKTTIVLAVLLAATPAFAQYGSSYGYGQPSPGATMHDYRLGPHQRPAAHARHQGRSVIERHPELGHLVHQH